METKEIVGLVAATVVGAALTYTGAKLFAKAFKRNEPETKEIVVEFANKAEMIARLKNALEILENSEDAPEGAI